MDKGKKNIERVIKSDRIQEKKKKFVVGLRNNLGNISKACDAVGISRTTYYDWIESDDLFKEDVGHIKESLLDLAECKLLENIEDNQNIAIIFYLKTKGKKRGYIEKQEVEVVRPISEVLFDEL
jgi:hypothetical protein|tara:strand:+ start:1271 stop:1642 length:372 start_codon:yes stop_codon:yes gene_type:complete